MKTDDNVDVMKNFNEALRTEIENIDKLLLPLLKEYLNNVRDIRMALGREINDIIRSSREVVAITKYNKELGDFIDNLVKLERILTPEMMDKMRRLTSGVEE